MANIIGSVLFGGDKKVGIGFLSLNKDYEVVRLGINTKVKPISILEIKFEFIEEYHDIFKEVINILREYSTRLVTLYRNLFL